MFYFLGWVCPLQNCTPGSLSSTASPPSSCSLPSLYLSPPLCPWGPSPFILTPRAITISVVTAGHVTCTCSSGWSPHAGAIWPHTHTHTQTSPLGCLLPSLPPSVFMASLPNCNITSRLGASLQPSSHQSFTSKSISQSMNQIGTIKWTSATFFFSNVPP